MTAPATAVLDRTARAVPEEPAAWTSVGDVVGVAFPLAPRPPAPPRPASRRTSSARVADKGHRRWAVSALMWAAAVAAGWMLYRQLSDVELGTVLASANWGWIVVALAGFALSLAGAAVNLVACSPVRLGLARTYAVQIACGFVKLISPSAVGGAALNARYVQQAGVSTPVAVASVGTAQVVQVATTLAVLAVLGPLTGTAAVPAAVRGGPGLAVLTGAAIGAVVVAVAALAVLPRLRGRLLRMLRSIATQARTAELTARSAARRLLVAVGGSLLLTTGLVLALAACVAAMGGTLAPVSVGMAFLIGSAVGSAVPTPGGLGTVEAALVAALVASGQSVAVALPAVLVFRAVTVWLPVPLGWAAFQLLRRDGSL